MADDLNIKVAETEHRARSNTRRIEKLELEHEALNRLATSVEVLANEQKHQTDAIHEMRKDLGRMDSRMEAVESKPAKRWDGLVDKIILGIAGALAGAALAGMGL